MEMEMIQYMDFCDWLLSLSIIFSRFIHVVAVSVLNAFYG